MTYTIIRRKAGPTKADGWADGYWADVPALAVDNFRPEGSDHRPGAEAKLAHSQDAIHVFFRVRDRYVRCVHTNLHDPVCRDSCVEFFVQPAGRDSYFNIEINCGGTMLMHYVEDPTRQNMHEGLKKYTPAEPDLAKTVKISASLPKVIDPEITTPTEWTIRYCLPVKLLEHYAGPLGPLGGQTWRANFYKCGDETSHPHWASWAPVGGKLNFHQPKYFAPIRFEP